jgi:D-alanyl-D-alanine carboxypeptidase (penicillin-binding protein 5/6)
MKIRILLIITALCLTLSSCNISFGYPSDSTSLNTENVDTTIETTENDTTAETITTENITNKDTTIDITTTEIQTTEPQTTEITTTEPLPPQTTFPIENNIIDLNNILAQAAFVYNVTDDEIIAIKGQERKIIPASITKLLTIQYALTLAPANLEITPHADDLALVGAGSSTAYIKTHHRLTVAQLIKGMMLPSGNDAAYTLATGVVRYAEGDPDLSAKEAVKIFMNGLNEYAKTLGCNSTFFTVPDGLAGDEHYASLSDLIIIGKNALNCELITEYAKIVSEKVKYASGHTITWNNTNRLINPNDTYYSPYVTGLKTGSLTDNYCLYISAEINGATYLIGIFESPTKTSRYDDAHTIIDSILSISE